MAEAAREYQIRAGQELRFEGVDKPDVNVVVKLVEGNCESFGTPLEVGRVYTFPVGAKAALAAIGGPCKVRFMNMMSVARVTEGNAFSGAVYGELIRELAERRTAAAAKESTGPNILVCGQTDTGKSTLCKYLLNSSIQAGHSVSFVDCDLGQNSITCPGSIAAVFLKDQHIDVEEGLSLLMPLAFYFGDLTLTGDNLGKYNHLCGQVGACVRAMGETQSSFKHGGSVVNTMGWVEDLGYSAIKMIAEALRIDVFVVMENKELHDRIREEHPAASVFSFQRGAGVVERPRTYRKNQRDRRIAEYFRGVNSMLRPVRVVVPFQSLYLFRVGATQPDEDSGVPAYLQCEPVAPDVSLNYTLAAVSHASCREEVAHANVAGFVIILSVDLDSQAFTLLLPSANEIPRRFLIVSKINAKCDSLQ